MRTVLFSVFVLLFAAEVCSQELIAHHFDANKKEIKVDTLLLGDYIVLGHAKKGRNPHYFQGKITGIFKDRNVVRVFDYARSTRVMPIAGKKIDIDEIIAIERLDEKKQKGRQNRAIAASAGQFLGSVVGGKAGDAIYIGSSVGNIVSDFASRQKLSTERVRCEIINVDY